MERNSKIANYVAKAAEAFLNTRSKYVNPEQAA